MQTRSVPVGYPSRAEVLFGVFCGATSRFIHLAPWPNCASLAIQLSQIISFHGESFAALAAGVAQFTSLHFDLPTLCLIACALLQWAVWSVKRGCVFIHNLGVHEVENEYHCSGSPERLSVGSMPAMAPCILRRHDCAEIVAEALSYFEGATASPHFGCRDRFESCACAIRAKRNHIWPLENLLRTLEELQLEPRI